MYRSAIVLLQFLINLVGVGVFERVTKLTGLHTREYSVLCEVLANGT